MSEDRRCINGPWPGRELVAAMSHIHGKYPPIRTDANYEWLNIPVSIDAPPPHS